MNKFLLGAALAIALSGATEPPVYKLPVETTYTVQDGDTLWSIAGRYMALNTYGPRDIREFQEGIKELNPWLATPERQYGWLLFPGDNLRINYWIRDEARHSHR